MLQVLHPLFELPLVLTDALLGRRRRRRRQQGCEATDDRLPEAVAEDLDHMLTRASRAILPDVEQPGGVLQALSKE